MYKIKIKNEVIDFSNFETFEENDTINVKIFHNKEVAITTRDIYDEASILECHNVIKLHNHFYCDYDLVKKLEEAGVNDGTEFIKIKDIYFSDVNNIFSKEVNIIKLMNKENTKMNNDNFKIIARSSRENVTFNINLPYPILKDVDNEKYYFPYTVSVWDKDIMVAEIVGIAFDEDIIEEHDLDFGETAGYISVKTGKVMEKLVNNELYSKKIDLDYWYLPTHSSYIRQIYIKPDYSESGIVDYIFKNLFSILQYSFNIHTRCLILQPYQYKKDESGRWCRDNDKQMDNAIKKALENSGYIQLDKTGLYAINCMSKKGETYEYI